MSYGDYPVYTIFLINKYALPNLIIVLFFRIVSINYLKTLNLIVFYANPIKNYQIV